MICVTVIGYFLLTNAEPHLELMMPTREECTPFLIPGGLDAKCDEIEICIEDMTDGRL